MHQETRTDTVDLIEEALCARLAAWGSPRPFIFGLCGSQGSGKSTATTALGKRLASTGKRVAVLSLDDFYFTKPQREGLAAKIHPLLITRGVPGTHDLELGERTLHTLSRAGQTLLPRFDKATDTRFGTNDWESFDGPADVIIFEGWCVGAQPQDPSALLAPVNELEATGDPDGRWRTWVNRQLAAGYQALFSRIDMLTLLAAPSFEIVSHWRNQQELQLRQSLEGRGADSTRTMSGEEIHRFVQHYQRLTEHILATMPTYADLVIQLDHERRPVDWIQPR